jgi:hypothetical protein
MESTFIISPENRSAMRRESSVFPTAVGPIIATAGEKNL